jgi:hypothetical protein
MLARVLILAALLAIPCRAELLVQDGDYYPFLEGFDDIRITGGRVDLLLIGGNSLTIEGGSIGEIQDGGNAPIIFRTGNFQLDTTPVDFFDIPFLVFDVYSLTSSPLGEGGTRIDYSAWFVDHSYGEFTAIFDKTSWVPDVDVIYNEHPPGDAQGDGMVNLQDMNLVRNDFGQDDNPVYDPNSDGVIDLADLNSVRNNFGADYLGESRIVPEPSTGGLLAMVFVLAGLGFLTGYGVRRR